MSGTAPPPPDGEGYAWATEDREQVAVIARNVTTRYLAIAADMLIGFLMLPFNLHHLGQDAYGLWMLTASVTIHVSILDLGYGGALVKFVAQYRAHRDPQALNEIASTLFFVFAAVGVTAYTIAAGLAFNLDHLFRISAAQAQTGQWLLLIIGLNVALNFPFSVYGGVVSGFQRYDANSLTAIASSIAVALTNVAILLGGFGLVPLVAATTSVRLLTYLIYRRNALRVYPPLRISPSLFRRSRLREATGFSVYSSLIDWANRLNYGLDAVVIGAFMGSAPVAVWAIAERVISGTQRLTNQLNGVLFPVVVDSDASNRPERLQRLLLEGTRLSLAMVLPIAVSLIVLADPLVRSWVGAKMIGSAPIIQILAVAVVLRVGNATGSTLLKGSGRHRYLAAVNITTGLANLALSATLIHAFGLIGVAVGTLIPIAISTTCVLHPAACRRVDLPLSRSLRQAIWPAMWPAAVAAIALLGSRQISSGTLLAVMFQAGAAAVLYFGLFFFIAIGRVDRTLYIARLRRLLGRDRQLAPAA
ncbi:MAG TPA: oligosaccharide flippase family protein [Vicinamibacterales bacterium]|nr:oligosaccharide flippase family protein [Vicinamibacterales bacterium]